MTRVALIAVVLAGLAAPAGLAEKRQAWTAKGIVTALTNRAITVNGHTCRLAGKVGLRAAQFFYPGDGVKIACTKGVLAKIAVVPFPPIIATGQPPAPSGDVLVVSSTLGTVTSSGIGTPNALLTLSGNFAITALGNGSISTVLGLIPATCAIGAGSPDLSGFNLADRLSGMQCRGNPLVLTSIARA